MYVLLQTSALNPRVDPLSSLHHQALWLVPHFGPEQQHKLAWPLLLLVFVIVKKPVNLQMIVTLTHSSNN